MTVKKLTTIEDGRLVPTDLSMDADLIEISKVEGNKLEAKEDGLYYSEASLKIEIGNTYATKVSVESTPKVIAYGSNGVLPNVKIFTTVVQAGSNGAWTVNYSHVGFTNTPVVTVSGRAVGTALGDRRFASLGVDQPTKTSCSGILLSSSLAGASTKTMVTGEGQVSVVAIGV